MNILFFIDDFASNSGICHDIKFSGEILEKYCDANVFYANYGGKYKSSEEKKLNLGDKSRISQFFLIKKFIYKNNIDLVHIRGLGMGSTNHFLSFSVSIFTSTKIVLNTFSQINTHALNHKVFFENPDVRIMNSKSLIFNKRNLLSNKILKYITPTLKRIYLFFIGRFFLNRVSMFVFFSNFEKEEVFNSFKRNIKYTIIPEPVLNYPFLKKTIDKYSGEENFYNIFFKKKFINIIYWGRLDYFHKGLDIILNSYSKFNCGVKNNLIRIHFMGPGYQGGDQILNSKISAYKLEELVYVHDANIWKNNPKPFIDSDFSICATRWDGFPRSLRESLAYSVPIIASNESNFTDLITENNCGFSFSNELELQQIFNKLNSSNYNIQELKNNCKQVVFEKIAESNIANICYSTYKKLL
jgi:glycosyltransferase involved in cell wall biosynthesis